MKGNIEERACQLALYIIENRTTVRAAAQKFGISKSTVHKDLSERLPAFNQPLYLQVKGVLEENKAERHIRGGIATRRKYKGARAGGGALSSWRPASGTGGGDAAGCRVPALLLFPPASDMIPSNQYQEGPP